VGVQKAFRVVQDHAAQCSAVYLAWPVICRGETKRERLPGSSLLDVIDTTPTHISTSA
jgi:hypothetical protein